MGLRRATRLSVQYALGAGIFVVLALTDQEPLWVLPVYGILVLVLALRIRGGRAIAGAMPAVIEKYEQEISMLRGLVEDGSGSDRGGLTE